MKDKIIIEPKVTDFLKGEFKYDDSGQVIWIVNNGKYQMIADVRAWGAIQHLFADKSGKIDFEKAGKYQDEIGRWIADALNTKLEAYQYWQSLTPEPKDKSK